jgi:hypothetical protein
MSSSSLSTSNQESQTSTAAPSPTGTSSTNTTAAPQTNIPTEGSEEENAETEGQKEEREKQEAMFDFMVGNYCVRRFLDSAEKALSSFSSSTTILPPPPPNPSSRSPQTQLSKLRRKLRKRIGKSLKQSVKVTEADVGSGVEEVILDREREVGEEREVDVEVRETPQPRRMMFGEIPPTSLPPSDSEEKPLMAHPTKKVGEGWEDGLFWYYHQPLLSPTSNTQSRDDGNDERDEDEGEDVVDEKLQKRSCFTVLKRGFGILSRRIGALFSSRCLGRGMRGMRIGIKGFKALEG